MVSRLVLILALALASISLFAQDKPVMHKWSLEFPGGQSRGNMEAALQNIRANPRDNASMVFFQVGGSKLSAKWVIPVAPTKAFLEIEHLSSAADVDFGGSSPVTLKLNGGVVVENFDPGSHGFTVTRFEITKFLQAGQNVLELTLTGGSTAYWLKRLELLGEFPPGTQFGGKVERLPAGKRAKYAIVVSRPTFREWRPVVEALQRKHDAVVIVYPAVVSEVRDELADIFPKYACFVEPLPDRAFVLAVHRLTRALDDDPYTDCLWGILTGYDMENARQIAEYKPPLRIRRGAGGTSLELNRFLEGAWYSEGEKNVMWEKKRGGTAEKKKCADDTTASLVEELNHHQPDFFLTSGHATQHDWQIGYSYKNGQFRCDQGQLFGLDLAGRRYPIQSPNPKVYLAAGNCLMGYVPDRNTMALAWMKTGGVLQMAGYTVSTFYGYGGWGVKDYLLLDDRHTFVESFFFAHQALLHEIQTRFPEAARLHIDKYNLEADPHLPEKLAQQLGIRKREALALLWHRDTLAFFGDPAWEARLEKVAEPAYEQELVEEGNKFSFKVTSWVNGTWTRPAAAFLPYRVKDIKVLEGTGLVTDNFVLLPPPAKAAKGQVFKLVFQVARRDF